MIDLKHQSFPPLDRPDLRFGEDAHPILRELQSRVDALPKECHNFVAALMSEETLVTKPLSDLIFGLVYIKYGISMEPIHQALATVVALRNELEVDKVQLRDEKMAFLVACRAEKAADRALKFVVDLQTLSPLDK